MLRREGRSFECCSFAYCLSYRWKSNAEREGEREAHFTRATAIFHHFTCVAKCKRQHLFAVAVAATRRRRRLPLSEIRRHCDSFFVNEAKRRTNAHNCMRWAHKYQVGPAASTSAHKAQEAKVACDIANNLIFALRHKLVGCARRRAQQAVVSSQIDSNNLPGSRRIDCSLTKHQIFMAAAAAAAMQTEVSRGGRRRIRRRRRRRRSTSSFDSYSSRF